MLNKFSRRSSRSAVSGASRLLAAAALVAVTLAPAAQAATVIAYSFSGAQASNQNFNGQLGMDFTVDTPITVTSLLAFDAGANGFAPGTSITVGIFTQGGALVGSSQTFTGTAGVVMGGSYRSLPVSFNLPVGNYSVVAQGFNGADGNYNTISLLAPPPPILNGGGFLTFGSYRYSGTASFGFPTAFTGAGDGAPGALNRFGAGSFEFTAVPEPAGVGTLLVGLGMFGFAARRRRSHLSA